MKLVANGCSHTSGAEIEYASQDKCHDKAWPKHLADLLGYDHVNLSMSGASSHRVIRTTFEFLHKHYRENNNSFQGIFMIIMWPGWYRTEIHTEDEEVSDDSQFYDNKWAPLIVGNDEHYKKSLDTNSYMYYKSWVNSVDRHQHIIDYYLNIILLQNTFEKYNIPYLFWNASMNTLMAHERDYDAYSFHLTGKRFPKMLDSGACFTELCRKSNQQISLGSKESGFGSHYDENAHKWFAKMLHRYIKNYLL